MPGLSRGNAMLLGGPRTCAQTAAIMSRHEDMHREGDLLKA